MTPHHEAHEGRRAADRPERRLNWTLLFFYFFLVLQAVFEESFTPYHLVTFGYYYIMIGMPGWMICWFAFLIFNEVHPVRRIWLHASLLVTLLAIVGYMNINP